MKARAISALVFVLTAALPIAAAPAPIARHAAAQVRGLYLLAATPDIYGEYGFPVTLYKAGPGATVERVRTIFTFAPGDMDVRADGRGRIYVVDENGLSIIHEADPARSDLVMAPGPDSVRRGAPVTNWAAWGYWVNWGVAVGSSGASFAVFSDSSRGRAPFVVVGVSGDAHAGASRTSVDDWRIYRGFRYAGPGGGPGSFIPTQVVIVAGHVQFGAITSPGVGVINAAPPGLPQAAGFVRTVAEPHGRALSDRNAAVLLADRNWFAFRAPLPGERDAWPKLVYAQNRRSGKWFTLRLPYMHLPPRLFGDWLCTIVQRPNPDRRPSPGEENERYVPVWKLRGSPYPNIRGTYKPDMYMPGILKLRNLKTGRVVAIHTGQQDSEVLGVALDGRVAYRVNDQIWVARMSGAGVGPAVLAAEGEDVPEVHWIFCRGGGDIGACLPEPPTANTQR
ncbi:MAG: hypothetical protein ACRD13_08345 [Terriglobales bacterium]